MQYKKEEVREKIVKAAAECFLKKGFKNTSVLDIAFKAGVPVGNLYRYFKHKSALYDAVVEDVTEFIPKFLEQQHEGDREWETKDISETAVKIAAAIAALFEEFGTQLMILTSKSEGTKYEGYYPKMLFSISQIIEKEMFKGDPETPSLMAQIVTKGFVDGLFTVFGEVPEKDIPHAIESLLIFYFKHWDDRCPHKTTVKIV